MRGVERKRLAFMERIDRAAPAGRHVCRRKSNHCLNFKLRRSDMLPGDVTKHVAPPELISMGIAVWVGRVIWDDQHGFACAYPTTLHQG